MKARSGMTRHRTLTAVVALALVSSVATTLAGTASASDRTATAHRAGAKTVAAKTTTKPKLFRLHHGAGEPTLGITRDGHVFYTASSGCVTSCAGSTQSLETVAPGGRAVFMTPDNGKTWKDVSPGVGGASPHALSLDPYLYVDKGGDNDRVYDIDLNAACSELSYTDDQGKTWITNPLACGEPVNDHQTLFSGKPVQSPTLIYPKVLYYCFNKLAYTACNKSLNGGLSFQPTATVPLEGDPECSGLNGHGVTDKQGTIYLPYRGCGGSPTIAISKNEGDSWSIVKVPDTKVSGGDPSVAVDRKGNLYFLWTDTDRKPMLATSRDSGKTWSKPVNVAAPGVVSTNLATLTVGAPGKVAIAYYGTTDDAKNGFWNAYMSSGVDVLGPSPLFYSASINNPKNPVKAKGCGPGRCGRALDFIDVEIAPDGAPWGAFVDACQEVCEKTGVESVKDNEGIVGTLVGGPRLNR